MSEYVLVPGDAVAVTSSGPVMGASSKAFLKIPARKVFEISRKIQLSSYRRTATYPGRQVKPIINMTADVVLVSRKKTECDQNAVNDGKAESNGNGTPRGGNNTRHHDDIKLG